MAEIENIDEFRTEFDAWFREVVREAATAEKWAKLPEDYSRRFLDLIEMDWNGNMPFEF